jgi:tRNA threonylcarbamoyladenosine biosynthesis protein TsaE
MEKTLHNLSDTQNLARIIADQIQAGQIYALHGDLGAGKTTLIQFIAKKLGIKEPLTSPTFVIQKIYPTNKDFELVHIDCYRFRTDSEAEDSGLLDFFSSGYVCFIEWAEKISGFLPKNTIHIYLSYIDEKTRQVKIEGLNNI